MRLLEIHLLKSVIIMTNAILMLKKKQQPEYSEIKIGFDIYFFIFIVENRKKKL